MKDPRTEHAEKVALFRYGLIADVLQPAPDDGRKLYERLQERASKSYCIPASRRTTVAVETMRDWISLYNAGGFDALKPKPRKDIGSARAIPIEVLDLLVATKDTHRDYSVSMVIDAVKKESAAARAIELPLSTVHRVLSRAGVMDRLPEDTTTKDRRHFSYEHAGDLWMSDVMHGPAVVVGNRRKQKTHLLGLLDDATRVIPYCAFTTAGSQSLLSTTASPPSSRPPNPGFLGLRTRPNARSASWIIAGDNNSDAGDDAVYPTSFTPGSGVVEAIALEKRARQRFR